ncbi:hypothetical protein PAMP_021785 [Pampus punctatissimus]
METQRKKRLLSSPARKPQPTPRENILQDKSASASQACHGTFRVCLLMDMKEEPPCCQSGNRTSTRAAVGSRVKPKDQFTASHLATEMINVLTDYSQPFYLFNYIKFVDEDLFIKQIRFCTNLWKPNSARKRQNV